MQQRITDMGRSPDLIGFQCDSRCSAGSGTFDTALGAEVAISFGSRAGSRCARATGIALDLAHGNTG